MLVFNLWMLTFYFQGLGHFACFKTKTIVLPVLQLPYSHFPNRRTRRFSEEYFVAEPNSLHHLNITRHSTKRLTFNLHVLYLLFVETWHTSKYHKSTS